ncbi:SMI1/KNR4 family protein [Streptomyces albogriseolus]|uniref:SMI1/KNR4 family protein n=1 Tax=Streptomyces albogriseolus TaxID=1887 RepID=UPI0036E1B431
MNFDQLDSYIDGALARHRSLGLPEEMAPFKLVQASQADIDQTEQVLEVQLPEQYKEFMCRYGGGSFASLDLIPIAASIEFSVNLTSLNSREERFALPFIAVAPVGTGDWWGFEVREGICCKEVSFYSFEDEMARIKYPNFLEFITREGLLVEG